MTTDPRQLVIPRPVKSYRRPRRRPAHLRTKTGCLTCRKRRKKCDERREICVNCAGRQIECIWPSPETPVTHGESHAERHLPSPLRSITPSPSPDGVIVSQYPQKDLWSVFPSSLENTPSIDDDEGEPTSSCSSNQSYESFDNQTAENAQLTIREQIYMPRIKSLSPHDGIIPPGSGPLFDLLQTKWLRQLIRPRAPGSLIELYHRESMAMALSEPLYMNSLLACCGAEYPVDNPHFQESFHRLGQKHYVSAVAALRKRLGPGSSALGPAIVRTILMLCIFERSKPWPSLGVGAHLAGLAQVVQSECNVTTSLRSLSVSELAIHRLTLEALIFHAATSVPFQPPIDQQSNLDGAIQLAEQKLENTFGGDTLACASSPVLGTRPKVFVLIREISLLYRESKKYVVDRSRCLMLQRTLSHIEAELLLNNGSPSSELLKSQEVPTISDLTISEDDTSIIGPRLYIISANILLADMLRGTGHGGSVPAMVLEGIQLVAQLQPSKDYYAEYYGWPIYVLARFVPDEQGRDCLLAQVGAFWRETRSGTMKRLIDILEGQKFDHYDPIELESM